MLSMYEIIRKKRDGLRLTEEEIRFVIKGYTKGRVPDYQMASLLMAMFIRGLDENESRVYTDAMLNSGQIIDLSDIPGIKVDKHSTGGVGDKVSIILAPIVAAAGVPVPMISGRGLGHTGGTLDKLESIPGFRVNLTIPEFKERLQKVGACLIGQTEEIVPADKKIYALRDVTATIESIPLICGSIMSKKIAEGIDALVLDIKTGSGAFMKEYEQSKELARQLIGIGEQFNKRTMAYITNMNQPLGNAVGNWLEIKECLDTLNGNGAEDLVEVTLTLAGTMIFLGEKADGIEDGIDKAREILRSGAAMDKFLEIVVAQNGDTHFLFHPDQYPKARYETEVKASTAGYLKQIDALKVGLAAVLLGAGRTRSEDEIDPKAGIIIHKKAPQKVEKDEVIMTLYTDNKQIIPEALKRLQDAIDYSETQPIPESLIFEFLDTSKA
ncbi:MAG: thymidine phosphorylase [Calditrichaeota bacterium]|nr:thymidine phosphorylase [Calditrichota bacterium]